MAYWSRKLSSMRVADVCATLAFVVFAVGLLALNFHMRPQRRPLQLHSKHSAGHVKHVDKIEQKIAMAASGEGSRQKRVRRETWTVPAEDNPIVRNEPAAGTCTQTTLLSTDFPNATCYGYCTSGSCSSTLLANLQDGSEELVCTAKIVLYGFKRAGGYEISRWLRQHSRVNYNYGSMFISTVDSTRRANFDSCPDVQIRDSTTNFYFPPYSTESIASSSTQKNYYLHCEDCLTTGTATQRDFSVFVNVTSALIPYIETANQKFIVTIKNPTDRVILEYFYPHIKSNADLTTVGNEVLHSTMSTAIDEAKECMQNFGPTACVYWSTYRNSKNLLPETVFLFESCYFVFLNQMKQHIPLAKTYFMKIEEYSADRVTQIQSLYEFLGLKYEGPIDLITYTPIHKPILPQTVQMLDDFFQPFNEELAAILQDNKWLYTRA